MLGGGGLASVYDPAVQETQIAQALSVFDTAFTTQMTWGKNTQPFNNAIQGGSLGFSGPKTPIISIQDTANFQIGLQKRSATGAQLGIVHNVNWLYQNSTFLVTPSVYTTNIQMTLTQPLMGSAPLPGQPVNKLHQPRRAGGEPGPDRDRPVAGRRERLELQAERHGNGPIDRAAVLDPGAEAHPALELREGGGPGPGDRQPRAGRAGGGQGHGGRRRGSPAAAGTVQPRARHPHVRPADHRAADAQPAGPSAGRQSADHPGHAPHRSSTRARLGRQPGPDVELLSRHRAAGDLGPNRRTPARDRPQPVAAAIEPQPALSAQRPRSAARQRRGRDDGGDHQGPRAGRGLEGAGGRLAVQSRLL